MDAGLSFIMANHARIKENDLVFDPFVGTGELFLPLPLAHRLPPVWDIMSQFFVSVSGSLLVACSHFGAYVCGIDIDYNTIHGRGKFCLLGAYLVFFTLLSSRFPKCVFVVQVARAVQTRNGEDPMRISELTCGNMAKRRCMWM